MGRKLFRIIALTMVLVLSVALIVSAAAWAPNTAYKVGDQVTYNGSTYQCIQAHTSLVGWEPPNVPALWQLVTGGATPTITKTPTPTRTPTATKTPTSPVGGDRCAGGTISASGENAPSEGMAQAFDNNSNTKWLAFSSTGWIQYDFAGTTAYAITQYTITSANDFSTRDPKNWTFQGSNNGSTWTTVDTRTNVTFSSRFQKQTFSFTNTTAYQIYRLNITANSGDSIIQLAEIEMFDSSGASTPSPVMTPTPTKTPTPTSGGGWSNFVYPTVYFTDNATGLEGSTILHNAVPDITGMMRETCLAICMKLFTDNNDDRNNFTILHLQLDNDPTGVAGKWGDAPEIWISISAQYIASFYHNNGNSYDMVKKEVQGILAHEGTHGYQYAPKNCGSYDGSSEFFAFVEGMADYIRTVTYQYSPTRYPGKGGDWHNGYNTGGFFIQWIVNNRKSTFAIEFNHAAGSYATFSWDTACRNITGEGVTQLWNEYQASLP